jgi:transposase
VTDTKGRPLDVIVTPGQHHDSTVAEALLEHATGAARIADTAYDADRIIEAIRADGAKPVIPSNPTRNKQRRPNKKLYWLRHRVEMFFHRLKRFRRIATRYEKTERNFTAFLHVACALAWL